jgi:hypothetical protein
LKRAKKRYGAGAETGAVVASTDSVTLARFKALGYAPSGIESTMTLTQRAGLLGPKKTYVTVFYLK